MTEKIYRPKGTCSTQIRLAIDDEGILRKLEFLNGCPGNTAGVSKLAVGRRADEVAELLRGTRCGLRPTSCPDQLARAIDEALAEQQAQA